MRILVVASLAAAVAGPALAYDQTMSANGEQVRAVAVAKRGVDFGDRSQVNGLYARLKRAADKACGMESADHRLAQPDRACVDEALARAVRGADKPLLTAAYQADAAAANRALAGNDQ